MISLGVATQGAAWLGVTGQTTDAEFLPSDILGLSQWLDAQDATTVINPSSGQATNGDKVATWVTKAGANNASQIVDAARPTLNTTGINGKRAISFDGTQGMAQNYANGANAITIIAVVNVTAGTGFRGIYSTAGSTVTTETMMLARTTNPQWATFGGATYSATSTIVGAGMKILTMRRIADGSGVFRVGNVADGTFAASSGQPGNVGGTTGQEMTGFIGELLVYNRALPDPELAQIHTYLNRWQPAA